MKRSTRTVGVLARPGAAAVDACTRTASLTLVGWHRIGHAEDGLSTSFDDFRRQLDALEQWDATVLPLQEATRLLATDSLPRRAVALTFDDGYASVLELAWPELRRRGLPATLFAVSGYLDPTVRFPWDRGHADADLVRLADSAALREAALDGLDIGSHTVTHRWLPHLTRSEVADELGASRRTLEDLLQKPITSFAYPMGGWNASIRDQVGEAGYDVGITVDRGRNGRGQDPLALRRAFAFDSSADFQLQLQNAFTWMRPIERWRTRSGPRS